MTYHENLEKAITEIKEALPGMGKFFYEIYKVIGAAQVIAFLKNNGYWES